MVPPGCALPGALPAARGPGRTGAAREGATGPGLRPAAGGRDRLLEGAERGGTTVVDRMLKKQSFFTVSPLRV